jgi:uncharacterized hydrophobic protein (TIGR00271 family)
MSEELRRRTRAGVAIVHLRLVVPPDLAEHTLNLLFSTPSVVNIVHLPGAAARPDGDLVLADVAREDASVIVEDLRAAGLEHRGSISLEAVEAALSDAAREAERQASGSAADAVVWEEVEHRTSESAELSWSFLAFMVLATLIAAIGIVSDSLILIIGAMIVGPEFGPLAGVSVAVVERRLGLARRSLTALAVGFPAGIAAAFAMTTVLRAADRAPEALGAGTHPATLFISKPNVYSVLVAVLAGIAGTLSLTTAKSGALIGVLISVTTIPAAANIGVAAAYADWPELAGASAQLALNLFSIIAAGVATLTVQRRLYGRRREDVVRRRTILAGLPVESRPRRRPWGRSRPR